MTAWHVYVEGKGDKRFLECLVRHMCIDGIDFRPLGGGHSTLRKMQPQLRRSSDKGNRLGLIMDANSDFQKQRDKLKRIIGDLGVSIDKIFLLPDDAHPGCLETLLQEVAVEPHREIYNYFKTYEECLRFRSDDHRLPGEKARVYAYCSALGIMTQPRQRDYCDTNYWNPDNATVLEPLKQFLQSLTH